MSMSAESPLVIRGPYFWNDGRRFLVRGVLYQAGFGEETDSSQVPIDTIADDRLLRLEHDVALLKELGVNTIYACSIDNTKAHDQAMKMLMEAGIFVLIKISSPREAIHPSAPYESYNADTMNSFFRTIDIMASYSNTLGILVADGLISDDRSMSCVPVFSAVIRDLKKYMKLMNEARGQRCLPVGYGTSVVEARDVEVLDYLSSGEEAYRIDFSTCKCYLDENNLGVETSGFNNLVERFQNTRIPIFLSEYSRAIRETRSFAETRALLSPPMTRVFSGGCAYEFWHSPNGFGLAKTLTRPQTAPPSRHPEKEILETRHTAWGTLDIYKDFTNYKESLDATRMILHNTDYDDSEVIAERTSTLLETRFPGMFNHRGQDLESCVSWVDLQPGI